VRFVALAILSFGELSFEELSSSEAWLEKFCTSWGKEDILALSFSFGRMTTKI
jgi:hypothetical protein